MQCYHVRHLLNDDERIRLQAVDYSVIVVVEMEEAARIASGLPDVYSVSVALQTEGNSALTLYCQVRQALELVLAGKT